MKKISLLLIGVISSISLSTFALNLPSQFSDENSFSDWFKSPVNKMRHHGIITGYSDGSFGPNKKVTRAELAVILDRFAAKIIGKDLEEKEVECTLDEGSDLTVYLHDVDGNEIEGADFYKGNTEKQFSHEENPSQKNAYYLFTGSGTKTVKIVKEGYRDHIESIRIPADLGGCTMGPITYKTITLVPEVK